MRVAMRSTCRGISVRPIEAASDAAVPSRVVPGPPTTRHCLKEIKVWPRQVSSRRISVLRAGVSAPARLAFQLGPYLVQSATVCQRQRIVAAHVCADRAIEQRPGHSYARARNGSFASSLTSFTIPGVRQAFQHPCASPPSPRRSNSATFIASMFVSDIETLSDLAPGGQRNENDWLATFSRILDPRAEVPPSLVSNPPSFRPV